MHSLDRPHQLETFNKILNSQAKYIIVQAPTGSGKSAWPAQMAIKEGVKTLALTRTKALQAQYRNSYEFAVLFGKSNYNCFGYGPSNEWSNDCVPMLKPGLVKADMCPGHCTKDNCEDWHCDRFCEYPRERRYFVNSVAGSLNYSKFLLDKFVVDKFGASYLFLDEAHELSDMTCDYAGLTLTWRQVENYANLLELHSVMPQSVKYQHASDWLSELLRILLKNEPSRKDEKEWRKWDNLSRRVGNTVDLMDLEPDCWFTHTDDKRIICKPTTARYHFTQLFDKARKIVLMSATIGKVNNFVRELGIEDYEYIEVPNVWPSPMRQIRDISDGMRLTYKSSSHERQQHANNILKCIDSCNEDWTGLILTPSKKLAWNLAETICRTGRPIYIPPTGYDSLPTEVVAQKWQDFYANNPSAVGLFWQLWEGYDGTDNQFCIIAKTPIPNFSEPYDKARFEFDKGAAWQRVANKLVQGFGRIRRGHVDHYGDNRLVAIADTVPIQVRNKISGDILSSFRR